jgi:type IV pilus assembly protein PilA
MTSLNSKLQLTIINRKKGRNLLEKGFTLVELMIVIVIVGILSAVALPNFLSQTDKAKATEAKTQAASLLKQVSVDSLGSNITAAVANVNTPNTGSVAVASGAGAWNYTLTGTTAGGVVLVTAAAKSNGNAAGGTNVYGCANPSTGATTIDQTATAITTC